MISQKPEGWQGERFPAFGPWISPLSLGKRGKRPCSRAADSAQRRGAFSPLLAASEQENAGGLGKEREQEEEGGQLMNPVHLSLATAKGPAQPPGTHQPCSKPVGAAAFQPTPATKFKAAQVVTLPLDHQASSVVCLKGIFPRNKTLRPLFLGCLAARCCHVFMARAACGRWGPKWRQL